VLDRADEIHGSMTAERVELSVVVTVYGCAACLRELCSRLTETLTGLVASYEIVLVDDRAGDGAWKVILDLAQADPGIRGFRLSRNFGQHAAITAGLAQTRGDRVVVMDCDLQDPPEEIPRLYAQALEGYDIVYGRREQREGSRLRHALSHVYFRIMNTFTGTSIDGSYGTFSVISRKVVDEYGRFRDRDRHYLFILYWLGFRSTSVGYKHRDRATGRSSYGPVQLLRHGLDGAFFQTTVLLRWIVYLGFLISAAGAAMAVYIVGAKLANSGAPGWTSLAVFVLVLSGFIITSTGITGLYIGKVFEQVKDRPLFIIEADTTPACSAAPPTVHELSGSPREA